MVPFNSTALSAQSTYGNLNPNELCYEQSEWQMENQSSKHLGKVISNCAFCFRCPSLKFLSGFCDFQVPSAICKCCVLKIYNDYSLPHSFQFIYSWITVSFDHT
jgi:hypothetical protein